MRTVSQIIIWVIPGQLLQVIPEQHLITWNPLDRFQHVVLQGQAATHLSTLKHRTTHERRTFRRIGISLPSRLYLDVLDNGSEDGGAFIPGPHQLHGLLKVLDVVGIHPQEGCVLKQNASQARALAPRSGKWSTTFYSLRSNDLGGRHVSLYIECLRST